MRSGPHNIHSGGGDRRPDGTGIARMLVPYLDRFRSADQLHELLARRNPSWGLTDVLQTLTQLVAAGRLEAIVGEDGRTLFRSCSQTRHHHLVCRSCGRTVEVLGPDIEVWVDHHARHHRYVAVKPTIEMYGLCPVCDLARRQDGSDPQPGSQGH